MPKKNTTTPDEAAGGDEAAAETAATETPSSTKSKGPSLIWDEARDYALVAAIAKGASSTRELATVLSDDAAFSGLPAGTVIPQKIAARVRKLRKDGIPIAQFGRSATYSPDVELLSQVLAGGSSS